MGGEHEHLARARPRRAPCGRIQRQATHLAAVDAPPPAPSGASATKKWVSKRTFTFAGVIQRRITSAAGSGASARLLLELPHGGAVASSPSPSPV